MNGSERFVQELARHQERLFAYVYSLLPSRPDAEDVFQRASVILWQKQEQRDPAVDFLSWACGIAFYEVRNFLRSSGRDRLRFGDSLLERLAEERPASLATRDERLSALEGCLSRLDASERELLRHAYGSESTVRDLARRDGRAAQTLYNRLARIRQKLFLCTQGARP